MWGGLLLCVFVAVHGLSLVAVSGVYSLGAMHGLLTGMASLVSEHGASVVMAQGLVAPPHVESSWTRDQICVPCVGSCILKTN